MIMETTFTPLTSLAGGTLIGLAAVLLMLTFGRILGVTGILRGVFFPSTLKDWSWRMAIIIGMLSAPSLVSFFTDHPIEITATASNGVLAIGGLIVGIGVTVGSGCTSGHGVCGLARLSPRSLAATLTFMATAALTVFVARHVLGG